MILEVTYYHASFALRGSITGFRFRYTDVASVLDGPEFVVVTRDMQTGAVVGEDTVVSLVREQIYCLTVFLRDEDSFGDIPDGWTRDVFARRFA